MLPVEVSADEVLAHARHTGHRGLDLVLALSAIFISLVSLFIAIEHGHTERDLVAANSWPYLQIESEIGNKSGVEFWIDNAGIGPAKLELFELSYDGRTMRSMPELLQRCCGLPVPNPAMPVSGLPDGYGSSDINDTVLRPGQRIRLFVVPASGIAEQLKRRLGAITFRGCYCSVFDECWMSNLMDLHPKRVSACPVSDTPFNRTLLNR
jgi:hypothetical protein